MFQTDKSARQKIEDNNVFNLKNESKIVDGLLDGLTFDEYFQISLQIGGVGPDLSSVVEKIENFGISPDKVAKYRTVGGFQYRGDRVTRQPRYPRPALFAVYFYYLTLGPDGGIIAKEYRRSQETEIASDDLKIIAKDLAVAAKNGAEPVEVGFKNMSWDKPCYICFMMDAGDWEFHFADEGKTSIDALHLSNRILGNHANRTFYNGGHYNFNFAATGDAPVNRTILWCENHHLTGGLENRPRENGDTSENYKLDLIFRVRHDPPLYDTNGDELRETVVFDPGGTNTGPPPDGGDIVEGPNET